MWERRSPGNPGIAAARLVNGQHAQRDVPDEVAVAGVARGDVVLELVEFPDVVQQGARNHEIDVRVVCGGQKAPGVCHLEHVLEEAAAIGVVHGHRRRPHAQPGFACVDHAVEQRTHERI